jgi:hypothetical protein
MPVKMPTPIKRPTSDFYWIRKKVPEKLRHLVGKTEVWASLKTKDERQANIKIGAVNAAIEAEWARLRAGGAPGAAALQNLEPAPFKLTFEQIPPVATVSWPNTVNRSFISDCAMIPTISRCNVLPFGVPAGTSTRTQPSGLDLR